MQLSVSVFNLKHSSLTVRVLLTLLLLMHQFLLISVVLNCSALR